MRVLFIFIGLLGLCVGGCSVVMALHGDDPRDYSVFKEGTPREVVLATFGSPDTSVTKAGKTIDSYDFEEGDESNPERGMVHVFADFVTLGAWELVGTPFELFEGEDVTYVVQYGPDGKLESVTPRPPGLGSTSSYSAYSGARVSPSPTRLTPTAISASAAPNEVDRVPRLSPRPGSRGHAVVVGVETYRENLPEAIYADHDARIVAQYVTQTLGYPEENVALLVNDRATRADLHKYIEGWLPNRVEPSDSVFVYFSGHGAPSTKTGAAFLVPYDGDPLYIDKTGYPLSTLYEYLNRLPAKEVLVVLDSCFSGAGGRSVIAKGMRPIMLSVENPVLAEGKILVLGASAGDQISNTYEQKRHGLLTYFFLKGLQGDGDEDGDGVIELTELYSFLKPQVERTARREFNNEQVPQLMGSPEVLSRGMRLLEREDL